MICSPERLAANRANARKSTGPRTPEGKAISRRNNLKHGLTGQGVALPDEDAAEVERRFARMNAELGPRTEMGHALALRAATLTVRLERCYRNEAARLGLAVDSALEGYDHARLDELDALMDGLHDAPHRNAVLLQRTPEGVMHTIRAWQALADQLARPGRPAWSDWEIRQAEGLLGRGMDERPRSRMRDLMEALCHRYHALPEGGEFAGMDDQARYEHARREMAKIVAGRIEDLSGFHARMDLAASGRARAGAADRALVDDSRESILARKYEAATERSLFRTLRELREVEAIAEAAGVCEELGSSLPAGPSGESPPVEVADPAEPHPAPPVPTEARRRPDPEKLRKQQREAARRGGWG